ncbi:WD40 repeat domain-containing protein [Streptomyces kebangsaanensis]|uniref:WD40 repeat domain-containing protein n=1 Tax=Streptomyces kebangsaanensis TaxID=864058 RepID=A0ABW6KX50_9ACTN
MRRPFALLAGALLLGALAVSAVPAASAVPAVPATPALSAASAADGDDGFTIKDPRIKESSGLAASRRHPGVYWTHNDSGYGPQIYAVDGRTGETVATVTLSGIGKPRDVEAVSIGPGDQIYVGDIGDNLGGTWPYVWIYRLPEPKELKDQTIRATQYVVKYADGPRDAESMVVHPKTGRVYIIDKKEDGGHLYEGPAELSASGTNVFEPIAPVDLWATDAALSPDGTRLAVRGYFGGIHYDWNGGRIKRIDRLAVPLQRQGESVTYSADGTKLLYGTEGENSPVEVRDAPGADSSAKSPSAPGGSSSAGSGSGGSGSDGSGGLGAGAAAAAVVAVVAVLGLGRLLRRRS